MSSDLSAIRRVVEGKAEISPAEMLADPEFSKWGKNVLEHLQENPSSAIDVLNYLQNKLNERVNPFKGKLPTQFQEPVQEKPVEKMAPKEPSISQEQFMKTQHSLLSSIGIGFDPAFADFIQAVGTFDGARVGSIVRSMMKGEISRQEAISKIKSAFSEYKKATE